MPKVSVIIATYNRSRLLAQAVESVLAQTFQDYEVIVVDDGSTDNTKEIIARYAPRISYIFQENKGRSESRNAGVRASAGEYIAFLDDDDLWLPHKLERQVAYLDSRPDIGLVHAFMEMIDEEGSPLANATKERLKFYRKAMRLGYTYSGISKMPVIFLSTSMLRRSCFDSVGFFDPAIPAFEDWDFYLRLAREYRIGIIPEPLIKFRLHKMHTSNKDFTQGRIATSLKHLASIDSLTDFSLRRCLRHNFYLHLANAYYVDKQAALFRAYAWKALKLKPWVLLQSRLGLHFFMSFLPMGVANTLRDSFGSVESRQGLYPERIIPEETASAPLASHLKRYDFAKQFAAHKTVLDAACGVGYGSDYLAGCAKEVIGIDISPEAIAYAQSHYQRENIRFAVMDVHKLEFPERYFDLACSFETLEHLEDPERYLSEVRRVLKEGGMFIVSTPRVQRTTRRPKDSYHKIEFSQKDFTGLLRRYFRDVEIFGQRRRRQSLLHYYLQKWDILRLRTGLRNSARKKICRILATQPWDEVDAGDFLISKEEIRLATELLAICR